MPGIGCRPGEPETCSDRTACTIDACVEATHACVHTPRDADGDGDPDGNCPGGGDCNDTDPSISSKAKEICGNGVDDNCNGKIDESPCIAPLYDLCSDPLVVKAASTYSLSAVAAKLDYSGKLHHDQPELQRSGGGGGRSRRRPCWTSTSRRPVPATSPWRLRRFAGTRRARSGAATCRRHRASRGSGFGHSSRATTPPTSSPIRRARSRSAVDYLAPEPAPTNETCGTALPITPDVHVVADLTSASADLTTACGPIFGDLVYSFSLATPSDVHLFAVANDSYGTPVLSLRDASCDKTSSEIGCHEAANAELYRRALPPGNIT